MGGHWVIRIKDTSLALEAVISEYVPTFRTLRNIVIINFIAWKNNRNISDYFLKFDSLLLNTFVSISINKIF